MTRPRYFQAIPLYSKADEGAFDYFKNNQPEINAITQNYLVVAVPDTVVRGDAGDLYGNAPRSKRYEGLKITDLPCLWIEDSTGHESIPLPNTKSDINRLIVQLTEAAKVANDVSELVGQSRPQLKEISLAESRHFRNIAIGAFVGFLIVIGIFYATLQTLRDYGSQVLIVSSYGVLGALMAIVLFGMMRSYGAIKSAEDGAIGSKRIGAVWEFGGPAALAIFVLLVGLTYEALSGHGKFNVSAYVYSEDSPAKLLHVDGTLKVDTRGGISANVLDGHFWLNEIDAELKGRSFRYEIIVNGYDQVEPEIQLTDATILYVHLRPRREEGTTTRAIVPDDSSVAPRPDPNSPNVAIHPYSDGWWFKVCTGAMTEAQTIKFFVGPTGSSRPVWRPGAKDRDAVDPTFLHDAQLRFKVEPYPSGAKAVVDVYYGKRCIRTIVATEAQDVTLSQGDSGATPACPDPR